MAKLAFLGLGVMGYQMAGHLQRAGHEVTVYNRSKDKSLRWAAEFTDHADKATPAEAAEGAVAVFCCLGNDQSVRDVVDGPQGVLASLTPGSVLIDHTTASAELARELAVACGERGAGFIDAPVSGGEAGAVNGVLTVMAGGEQQWFDAVEPYISCYAQRVRLLGPVGAGQLCKMVNQICVAGVVGGLAEGLHFAHRAGLDVGAVVEVISKGAAQSWQMENRYETMMAGQYAHGFAVDWMRKDLGIVMDAARDNGAQLPLTALIDQLYAEVQRMGGGRWDTSSLLARLQPEQVETEAYEHQ